MSMSIDEKRAQYTKLSKYINTPNKFRNKLMKAISKGYPINYAHPYTGETLLNNLLMYQGTEYTHDRLIEDIKFMLNLGADVNKLNKDGENSLMKAINCHTPLEAIKLILQKTQELNLKNIDENTAFSITCRWYIFDGDYADYAHRNKKIIQALLRAGADPYLDDSWIAIDYDDIYYIYNVDDNVTLTERQKELKIFVDQQYEQVNAIRNTKKSTTYEYEL